MRLEIVVNNYEAEDNGDEQTFQEVCEDIRELLRMRYYEVETISNSPEHQGD